MRQLNTLLFLLLTLSLFAQPTDRCLHLDGRGDFVVIDLNKVPGEQYAIDLWCISGNGDQGTQFNRLFTWGGNNTRFEIGEMNGFFTVYRYGKDGNEQLDMQPAWMRDGKWHHIVASWERDVITVAMDDACLVRYNNNSNNQKQVVLGGWFDGGENWHGAIDEVRFWKRAISYNEIKGMQARDFAQKDLWGHFDFNAGIPGGDNKTLNVAADKTGVLANAVIRNFTLCCGNPSNWVKIDLDWENYAQKQPEIKNEVTTQTQQNNAEGEDEFTKTDNGVNYDVFYPLKKVEDFPGFVQINLFLGVPILEGKERSVDHISTYIDLIGQPRTANGKHWEYKFLSKDNYYFKSKLRDTVSYMTLETQETVKGEAIRKLTAQYVYENPNDVAEHLLWLHKVLMNEAALIPVSLPDSAGFSRLQYNIPSGVVILAAARGKGMLPCIRATFDVFDSFAYGLSPDTEVAMLEPPRTDNKAARDEDLQKVEAARKLSANNNSEENRHNLSVKLNSLAWSEMILGNFAVAEGYVREAIALNPANLFPRTNLPPCLLFQGKFDEAEKLYQEWKDKPFGYNGFPLFKDAFLDDFKTLENENSISSDFFGGLAMIRELLKQ